MGAGAKKADEKRSPGRSRTGKLPLGRTAGAVALSMLVSGCGVMSPRADPLLFGTLVTSASRAAQEAASGVSVGMIELSWAEWEPQQGLFDEPYISSVQAWLRKLQQAGMKVTLGLGTQSTPSWIFSLPGSTYVNQVGTASTEANFVFNQAVRQLAAQYLASVAAKLGLSSFWAIRLTSGGDPEMLYPPGGSYWAFDQAALTGRGLPPTMTPNPFPSWRPGNAGLTLAQVNKWVDWYVGGLDDVTNWQMRTLSGLGFSGIYELVTPGSGTRPDRLAQEEREGLPDGTTGVGAVWDRYYAGISDKHNVMAYVSSVADGSGNNDSCQPGDDGIPISSPLMGPWSATRWISRIADQYRLLKGGENPGWGASDALDAQYADLAPDGMMATAIRQATSCGFIVFYWAHDDNLWEGTLPFSAYAAAIAEGKDRSSGSSP
ncbi:MAG TPA: beta-galactosidase [Acidimicrobiales bacterium]|nr:beta-galactosidase [Acidimicrobiales bacterium]